MFERFTDRARRTLVIAQDEARSLGHGFIGPEHLVLAMFQVGGVAATALMREGANLDEVRSRIVAAAPPTGSGPKGDRLPFTPTAKKTLELALREALRLKHNYIGTEHLLLGVLRGAAHDDLVVASLGVDSERLYATVMELIDSFSPSAETPAPSASLAFEEALESARRLAGVRLATTGHLVAAVLADSKSQGARALAGFGVTPETFAGALGQTPIDGTSDGPRRTLEIKLGEQSTTISEDPEVIEALAAMTPDQLRATFGRLRDVLEGESGPGAGPPETDSGQEGAT